MSEGLTPAQSALAAEVKGILEAAGGKFPIRALIGAARASGVLSGPDLRALDRRGRLPDWMLGALGLGDLPPPSTAFRTETVFTGRSHRMTPSRVLHATALPATFGAKWGRSPDVELVSGEHAELVVANAAKACLLADGYVPAMTDEDNLWAWGILGRQEPVRLDGHTLVLVVEGSRLFSHWLLDTLPRFEALRQAGPKVADYDHVLIASAEFPYHAETLAALGIAEERLVTRVRRGDRFSCERLDHVTPVRTGFAADTWLYDFIARTFGAPPCKPTRKLFVSRSKSKRRRILNEEAELHPLLEARGFEIVYAERLSLKEMAKLCAEATVVAGTHGAGLSNVVFCQEGAKVLEIFGAHLASECWNICNGKGLSHACWQARDADGAPFTPEGLAGIGSFEKREADMVLPAEECMAMLDQLETG